MVLKIGRFLMNYIDESTGLPLASYDLWEEQHGIFSYTAATTYAGLKAAENLSRVTGHHQDEATFRRAARKMKASIKKHLYSQEAQRFVKKLYWENEEWHMDTTVDASLAFLWDLGVFAADDPLIVSTMKAIESELTVQTDVGGIARYSGDFYHRDWNEQYSQDVPGNPWIITTLWLANWKMATAKTTKELHPVRETFDWVIKQASQSGILPEQMHPYTGEPLSVAPLTWSHSTFVDSVLRYQARYNELKTK